MPEFYRNAWYAQLKKKVDELEEEIQKAIELPTVTSVDEGKVLTVDNDGKWAAENVPKELPVVQTTDAGKVLTVDNAGEWGAETPETELPSVTSADEGKVLTVDSNGEWGAETPSGGGVSYSTNEQEVGTWVDGTTKVYQKVFHIYDSFSQYGNRQISVPGTVISHSYYAIKDAAGILTYVTAQDALAPVKIEISADTAVVGSTITIRIPESGATMYTVVLIARYVKKTLVDMKIS